MISQLLLVSTCGTSLLTNDADGETRSWLTAIANKKNLTGADAERLRQHVTNTEALVKRMGRLSRADRRDRQRLGAELCGICAELDRRNFRSIQHLLIHSDTDAGRAAATLVEDILLDEGHQVQLLTAGGLRTDDLPSFRDALAELTKQIEELVPGYREQGWTTYFNLTGGFKSVNAYLQALGMLYADRCVFLFEGQPTLMEIPRLPVKLAEADEVREHLTAFRRLMLGYLVAEREVVDVPDSLLLIDDGQVTRSVWGDVVWERVRKRLLRERLLDPLSPKLVISHAARKAFEKLEEDRRIQVNEALDALSANLDFNRELPKSNTLKKLAGNPALPSTHELYLWSDGAAWRAFGHFEADRFVVDSLGPHL